MARPSILLLISLCLFGVLAPRIAVADDARKQAEGHFKQAEAYMKTGVFDKAAAEYQAAYDLVPSAHGFLFNIGLAHERGDALEAAAKAYRLYIERDPEGRKVIEAKARLASVEKRIATAEQEPDPPPPDPKTERPDLTERVPDEGVPTRRGKNKWMYYAIAAGLVTTGVLLDTLPGSASNDKYDALDFVPAGLYLGAAGLAIYGTF